MTLDELRFNAKFAWENTYLRWFGLSICLFLSVVSILAAIKLVQLGLPSGFIVTHYTVYLGIDQMLPLPWLAVIISVPLLVIFGTMVSGFLFFRQDALAGQALMALSGTSAIVWSIFLYYLVKINT